MKTVGIFEAKTHFSALVDEARNGHTIVITRNGEPVAQMVPMPSRNADARGAMDRILSSHAKLKGIPTKSLVEEGRRH
ncbi:MAG TPA: type II toxin-antitoxin system prevent-host-death family antitoxin [Candidatus Tumulicola sp.]|jgi:prevent-host-death family protein